MDLNKNIDRAFDICRDVFLKKLKDYGVSWRIMRTKSLTDQIFIKANRIRSVQIAGEALVNESIDGDFIAIVNYGIIAIIQSTLPTVAENDLSEEEAIALYDKYAKETKELLKKKNHDYGSVWQSMRLESFVDIILTKIYRTKQIEDNNGKTLISEGVESNYMDMVNYSIFALVKLDVR